MQIEKFGLFRAAGLLLSLVLACSKSPEVKLCPYKAGDKLADTHPTLPRAADIKLDHIIVLMQENRSFDHYFQALPTDAGLDVDVAPSSASNPSLEGPVSFSLAATPCLGVVPHSWNAVHRQIAYGMSGFAFEGGRTAMQHYDASWLPFYYTLASTFSVADRYFSSVPGPTWPNRMFMLSGTSYGHIRNAPPPARDEERSIFHQLEEAGVTWAVYAAARPTFEEQIFPKLASEKGEHFLDVPAFLAAASSGELPAFSWVTSAGQHNEHPPKNVQEGEEFVEAIVSAVLHSPAWERTALFFTYDEHGGFYDHVPPPSACPPDKTAPIRRSDDVNEGFDRLGVRVPLIVISPFAKRHYVSHTVYDHTSILRFVQARFDLPALSGRDAHAVPPLDMFDFDATDMSVPELPPAAEDPAWVSQCPDTEGTDYDDEAATGT
jgi:phospholipase C